MLWKWEEQCSENWMSLKTSVICNQGGIHQAGCGADAGI